MMLPRRLPSVSIFDDTTIGSANVGADTATLSAAPTISDFSKFILLSFGLQKALHASDNSFEPWPLRRLDDKSAPQRMTRPSSAESTTIQAPPWRTQNLALIGASESKW